MNSNSNTVEIAKKPMIKQVLPMKKVKTPIVVLTTSSPFSEPPAPITESTIDAATERPNSELIDTVSLPGSLPAPELGAIEMAALSRTLDVTILPPGTRHGPQPAAKVPAGPPRPEVIPHKKGHLLKRVIDFFHHLGHPSARREHSPPPSDMEKMEQIVPGAYTPKPTNLEPNVVYVVPGAAIVNTNGANSSLGNSAAPNGAAPKQMSTASPAAAHQHSNRFWHIFSLSRFMAARETDVDPDAVSEDEMAVIHQSMPGKDIRDLSMRKKYRLLSNKIVGKGASGVVKLGCSLEDSPLVDSPSVPIFSSSPNSSSSSASLNSIASEASIAKKAKVLAVKEFRKRRKNESPCEYIHKLTTEFAIAARLNHRNMIHTLDMVHDGSKWYEVMEYCSNGDLFHFIQKGGLSDMDDVNYCFRQLVEGVQYMHSAGIAHRDLKPENLLIDDFGVLKITDFGISEIVQPDLFNKEPHLPHPSSPSLSTDGVNAGEKRLILSRGVCGSSPYIAPEEYTGGDYDARKVDVWSLGIIYFAMVFHGIPWVEATLRDPNYLQFITYGPTKFEPFKRLGCGPCNLLKRILEPDPMKRIGMEAIFNDSWFKTIGPGRISKPTQSPHSSLSSSSN